MRIMIDTNVVKLALFNIFNKFIQVKIVTKE